MPDKHRIAQLATDAAWTLAQVSGSLSGSGAKSCRPWRSRGTPDRATWAADRNSVQ